MIRLAKLLSQDADVSSVLAFDPEVPQTNMVHVYLKPAYHVCEKVRDEVEAAKGICVFKRLRKDLGGSKDEHGFGAYFEWAIGEANGSIDDGVFLEGWRDFAARIQAATG